MQRRSEITVFYRATGKECIVGRICKRHNGKRIRVLPDNKLAGQLSLYYEPSDNSARVLENGKLQFRV